MMIIIMEMRKYFLIIVTGILANSEWQDVLSTYPGLAAAYIFQFKDVK